MLFGRTAGRIFYYKPFKYHINHFISFVTGLPRNNRCR